MTFPPSLRTAGLCALLVLSPAGSFAAETKPVLPPPLTPNMTPAEVMQEIQREQERGRTTATAAEAAMKADPWQRRMQELRYEGVPLTELMRILEEKFPEINFVLTPGEEDPSMALNLRGVTLDDIFTAVNLATRGRVQAAKISDRMVNIKLVEAAAPEPAPKKICRAFSLGRYLSGRSDDEMEVALKDLEDALQRCWTMLQKANPTDPALQQPELSLHRTTKLLLVVGVPEQLAVVEEVVNQLEGVPSSAAIDPATGLPTAGMAGGFGGGGGRGGMGGFGGGGGRGVGPVSAPGMDPASLEAFRRRYGLTPQPTPANPPSTNQPSATKF